MYINLLQIFLGGGGGMPKMLVLCNFLKILMVSDKTLHRAYRTHKTLQTKPIREIFHFHQNYTCTLALTKNVGKKKSLATRYMYMYNQAFW